MSDEVVTIATPHGDVAELAQGYMNRVDGHRLLVPLAGQAAEGEAIQFAIVLADGTPAFMGIGRCSQVTDQGEGAPAELRFETLLDSLQFDDRSQPVYDYIVAIRTQAVATTPAEELEQAQPGVQAAPQGDAEEAQAFEYTADDPDEEPTEFLSTEAAMAEMEEGQEQEAWTGAGVSETPPMESFDEAQAIQSGHPSFVPPAIPTGMLSRPAISMHWQPAKPVRPEPAASTGLFRYPAGGLPAPAAPPFPELDPSQFVQPAPRPNGQVAEQAAEAALEQAGADEVQQGEAPAVALEEQAEAEDWAAVDTQDTDLVAQVAEAERAVAGSADEADEPEWEASDDGAEVEADDAALSDDEAAAVGQAAVDDADEPAWEASDDGAEVEVAEASLTDEDAADEEQPRTD